MAHAKRRYGEGDTPVPGYKLVAWLGRGQFGEAWKAVGHGGQECCLKIIDLGEYGGIREFSGLQEVKGVRHPNLVPVFALWVKTRDGRIVDDEEEVSQIMGQWSQRRGSKRIDKTPTWSDTSDLSPPQPEELIIAMGLGTKTLFERWEEFNDGIPEEQRQGISRNELLRYMEDSAKGIDFLNGLGDDPSANPRPIIHGDIKPHNLLIVGNSVQVCDFGLARAVENLRKTSKGMGTYAYAGPELLSRNPRPHPHSDQYCLAVSYVELRTGYLPFDETSLSDMLDRKRVGELDLSKLSEAERAVIERATLPDPKKRWPCCRDMVRALSRVCRDANRPAVSVTPPPEVKRGTMGRTAALYADDTQQTSEFVISSDTPPADETTSLPGGVAPEMDSPLSSETPLPSDALQETFESPPGKREIRQTPVHRETVPVVQDVPSPAAGDGLDADEAEIAAPSDDAVPDDALPDNAVPDDAAPPAPEVPQAVRVDDARSTPPAPSWASGSKKGPTFPLRTKWLALAGAVVVGAALAAVFFTGDGSWWNKFHHLVEQHEFVDAVALLNSPPDDLAERWDTDVGERLTACLKEIAAQQEHQGYGRAVQALNSTPSTFVDADVERRWGQLRQTLWQELRAEWRKHLIATAHAKSFAEAFAEFTAAAAELQDDATRTALRNAWNNAWGQRLDDHDFFGAANLLVGDALPQLIAEDAGGEKELALRARWAERVEELATAKAHTDAVAMLQLDLPVEIPDEETERLWGVLAEAWDTDLDSRLCNDEFPQAAELVRETPAVLLGRSSNGTSPAELEQYVRRFWLDRIETETWPHAVRLHEYGNVLGECGTLLSEFPECDEAELIRARARLAEEDFASAADGLAALEASEELPAALERLHTTLDLLIRWHPRAAADVSEADPTASAKQLVELGEYVALRDPAVFGHLTAGESHQLCASCNRLLETLRDRLKARAESGTFDRVETEATLGADAAELVLPLPSDSQSELQKRAGEFALWSALSRTITVCSGSGADAAAVKQALSSLLPLLPADEAQRFSRLTFPVRRALAAALANTATVPQPSIENLDSAINLLTACIKSTTEVELREPLTRLWETMIAIRIKRAELPSRKDWDTLHVRLAFDNTDKRVRIHSDLVDAWRVECAMVVDGVDLPAGTLAATELPTSPPAYYRYVLAGDLSRLGQVDPARRNVGRELSNLTGLFEQATNPPSFLEVQGRLEKAAAMAVAVAAAFRTKQATADRLPDNPFSRGAAELCYRLLRRVRQRGNDLLDADQQRELAITLALAAWHLPAEGGTAAGVKRDPPLARELTEKLLREASDDELADDAPPVLYTAVRSRVAAAGESLSEAEHKFAVEACARLLKWTHDNGSYAGGRAGTIYTQVIVPLAAAAWRDAAATQRGDLDLERYFAGAARFLWNHRYAEQRPWENQGTRHVSTGEMVERFLSQAITIHPKHPDRRTDELADYCLLRGAVRLDRLAPDEDGAKIDCIRALILMGAFSKIDVERAFDAAWIERQQDTIWASILDDLQPGPENVTSDLLRAYGLLSKAYLVEADGHARLEDRRRALDAAIKVGQHVRHYAKAQPSTGSDSRIQNAWVSYYLVNLSNANLKRALCTALDLTDADGDFFKRQKAYLQQAVACAERAKLFTQFNDNYPWLARGNALEDLAWWVESDPAANYEAAAGEFAAAASKGFSPAEAYTNLARCYYKSVVDTGLGDAENWNATEKLRQSKLSLEKALTAESGSPSVEGRLFSGLISLHEGDLAAADLAFERAKAAARGQRRARCAAQWAKWALAGVGNDLPYPEESRQRRIAAEPGAGWQRLGDRECWYKDAQRRIDALDDESFADEAAAIRGQLHLKRQEFAEAVAACNAGLRGTGGAPLSPSETDSTHARLLLIRADARLRQGPSSAADIESIIADASRVAELAVSRDTAADALSLRVLARRGAYVLTPQDATLTRGMEDCRSYLRLKGRRPRDGAVLLSGAWLGGEHLSENVATAQSPSAADARLAAEVLSWLTIVRKEIESGGGSFEEKEKQILIVRDARGRIAGTCLKIVRSRAAAAGDPATVEPDQMPTLLEWLEFGVGVVADMPEANAAPHLADAVTWCDKADGILQRLIADAAAGAPRDALDSRRQQVQAQRRVFDGRRT